MSRALRDQVALFPKRGDRISIVRLVLAGGGRIRAFSWVFPEPLMGLRPSSPTRVTSPCLGDFDTKRSEHVQWEHASRSRSP